MQELAFRGVLPNVKDNDGNPFSASLTENEVLEDLPDVSYARSIKRIVFAIEFGFTLHTP